MNFCFLNLVLKVWLHSVPSIEAGLGIGCWAVVVASDPEYRFLASQDALEVMFVTYLLNYWVSVSTDLTDVTLVSDDTYGDDKEDEEDDEDEEDKIVKEDEAVKVVKEVK